MMKKRPLTTISPSTSRSRSRSNEKNQTKHQGKRADPGRKDQEDDGVDNNKAESKIREYFGYTNLNNPFGDPTLSNQFVWKKKLEQKATEGGKDLTKKDLESKQEELLREIEKVRKRRAERELEKAKMDEEKNRLAREREEEMYEMWLEKERGFQLEQAKMRAEIRIKQGRETPTDEVVKMVMIYKKEHPAPPADSPVDLQLQQPWAIFENRSVQDLNNMLQELKIHAAIDRTTRFNKLWKELLILLENKIQELELAEAAKQGFQQRQVIASEYEADINDMLEGKNSAELENLEKEIKSMMGNPGDFKMDFDYWDTLAKRLKVAKAKAVVKEFYIEFSRERELSASEVGEQGEMRKDAKHAPHVALLASDGSLSPPLLEPNEELDALVVTEEEDRKNLERNRMEILLNELAKLLDKYQGKLQPTKEKEGKGEEDGGKKEAAPTGKTGLKNEDAVKEQIQNFQKQFPERPFEENFDEQVTVAKKYDWHDRYKPRKPQYFNRVKMAYEWNKYNQTHYDQDNPPPKVIQGYKFNIFYPDLINPTETPQYYLEPTDNPEFCIIRFHAGPPYEDIAFKILSKEWETNDRHGFVSVFERGVLHLYFNYKKIRYRR